MGFLDSATRIRTRLPYRHSRITIAYLGGELDRAGHDDRIDHLNKACVPLSEAVLPRSLLGPIRIGIRRFEIVAGSRTSSQPRIVRLWAIFKHHSRATASRMMVANLRAAGPMASRSGNTRNNCTDLSGMPATGNTL